MQVPAVFMPVTWGREERTRAATDGAGETAGESTASGFSFFNDAEAQQVGSGHSTPLMLPQGRGVEVGGAHQALVYGIWACAATCYHPPATVVTN
jgi:hypothetical protein